MADAKVNFELVPDMDLDDLHDEGVSGRGTSVFLRDTLNGPVVEKFAKEYGAFASDVNILNSALAELEVKSSAEA